MDGVNPRDVVRGLWLRRRPLALLAAALFGAGLLVVATLPPQYRASAVVAMRAQHPAGDVVLPTVSTQPEDRLKTLDAELLAAPLLQRVVTELAVAPGLPTMDARVAKLRGQVDLKVEGDDVFTVSVTARDPKLAAAAANRLPAIYADGVRKDRLTQAERAARIFGPEIAALRSALVRQDAGIARFKAERLGDLPEQLDGNLRGLDDTLLLEERTGEALMDAERRHAALLTSGRDDATALGRLRRRSEDLAKELTDARAQWTEGHPEVQRLERDLALTGARLQRVEGQQTDTARELRAVDAEAADLRRRQAALDRKASDLRRRVEETPATAEALSALTRDREATQAKYEALLGRQVEAELALALEKRQSADLFHVVAPATPPARPARPDRAAGALLALLAALAVTALAGTALEIADDTLRDAKDAGARLGVPVLAVVPRFSTTSGRPVRLAEQQRT